MRADILVVATCLFISACHPRVEAPGNPKACDEAAHENSETCAEVRSGVDAPGGETNAAPLGSGESTSEEPAPIADAYRDVANQIIDHVTTSSAGINRWVSLCDDGGHRLVGT